jgi:hypothetical protein
LLGLGEVDEFEVLAVFLDFIREEGFHESRAHVLVVLGQVLDNPKIARLVPVEAALHCIHKWRFKRIKKRPPGSAITPTSKPTILKGIPLILFAHSQGVNPSRSSIRSDRITIKERA